MQPFRPSTMHHSLREGYYLARTTAWVGLPPITETLEPRIFRTSGCAHCCPDAVHCIHPSSSTLGMQHTNGHVDAHTLRIVVFRIKAGLRIHLAGFNIAPGLGVAHCMVDRPQHHAGMAGDRQSPSSSYVSRLRCSPSARLSPLAMHVYTNAK